MVNTSMYKIIDSRNIEIKDGRYIRQCDIMSDNIESLPDDIDCEQDNIGFGSIAWCIEEKTYKVLNSEGNWT